MSHDPAQYIAQFPKKRILVIGDVMLDEYIEGSADRISPEAPIPVLLQKSVRYTLGGAGNVAGNAAALGARVTLMGIIGNDGHAKILRDLCRERSLTTRFLVDQRRPTTTKIRFVSGHHQLVRIDIEEKSVLRGTQESQMLASIRSLPKHDFVIVSDYAKGCITKKVLTALRSKFGAHRVVADMKPRNAPFYAGILAITPNVKEAAELSGLMANSNADALRVVRELERDFRTSVILTRGEHGVTVHDREKRVTRHFPSNVHTVRDVTGAGDTLIAVVALMLSCGAPLLVASEIANLAAGIVVGVAGTHALTKRELQEFLQQ